MKRTGKSDILLTLNCLFDNITNHEKGIIIMYYQLVISEILVKNEIS